VTLDSDFVMADPSMTREEFYVATSRTRGETFIYATPEVQLAREEIAPDSPYLRHGLEHIAEAAGRISAQSTAHDEALRSQFAQMPTDELARRVHELRSEAAAEQHNEARHLRVEESTRRASEQVESFRSRSGVHPSNEEAALGRIETARAERERLPEIGHDFRAKAAVAEHVLSERERAAATAARLSPPAYIKSELGERPKDPAKAAAWDRAVRGIESYRVRNGVVDRHNAFGPKLKDRAAQARQRQARERLQRTQRQLGLKRQLQRAAKRSLGLGIGR
jgi:hypothetical protein